MKSTGLSWLAFLGSLAGVSCAVLPAGAAPARTFGFMVTYFWLDMYESAEDCPDGFTPGAEDFLLLQVPERERVRLKQPENREALEKTVAALVAKANKGQQNLFSSRNSSCSFPEKFVGTDPLPMKTVTGTRANGMDLDGGGSAGTCPHTEFTSPDGRPGIDNQMYRVLGCKAGYRRDSGWGSGSVEDSHHGPRKDGQMAILIELKGVDDLQNDPDVDVGLYSSRDPTTYFKDTGANGNGGLPYTSMTVTDEPRYHNHVKGRIENGILTTDAADLRLQFAWATMVTEYWIRGSRLRLPLTPVDGATELIEGQLGGYYDLRTFWSTYFGNTSGAGCPSVWEKLHEMADGFPDPATGQCTAISTAYKVQAVPAFVVHPETPPDGARWTAGLEGADRR